MGVVPIYHYLFSSMNLHPQCSSNFCFCQLNYGKCMCNMEDHLSKQEHEKRDMVCGINKPLPERHEGTITTRSDFKTINKRNSTTVIIDPITVKYKEAVYLVSQEYYSRIFRPPQLSITNPLFL